MAMFYAGRFIGGALQVASLIDVTNTEAFLVRKDADGGDIFTIDTTNGKTIFGSVGNLGSETHPLISFGDGDSGFYEAADDTIRISIAESGRWEFIGQSFRALNSLGPEFVNEAASVTNPTINPRRINEDGMGSGGSGQISLIANSVEILRIDGDSTALNTRLMIYDVDNATLERVSVGIADSGGSGFKVLRIPN